MRQIIVIALCSVTSAFIALGLYVSFFSVKPETPLVINNYSRPTTHLARAPEVGTEPSSFIAAAKASREGVVFVETISESRTSNTNVHMSAGSGVIITEDGYITTNNHVIEKAGDIRITLNDNREFRAEVVGADPTTDLALLKIEANGLPFLNFGDSDLLEVGEWVLAVGNPFKLNSTVTAGIVSAKARNINILQTQGIEAFIQTDAAVNPGNSGGALVNTRGRLVGINTAIISESGRYEGFSFAVPSNLVEKVVYDLRTYGAVQRGWLGITITNVTDAMAKEKSLEEVKGIHIDLVTRSSAAEKAGLESGDVILSINSFNVSTVPEFMEQVGKHRPGDLVKIDFIRNGRLHSLDVTLRNQLNSTDFVAVRKDKVLREMGWELRELDTEEKGRLRNDGVYVVSIYQNSKISSTNMDPGYIITSINSQKISTVNELIELVKDADGRLYVEGYYENYPGTYPYSFYK